MPETITLIPSFLSHMVTCRARYILLQGLEDVTYTALRARARFAGVVGQNITILSLDWIKHVPLLPPLHSGVS
jgi:hypothetical protein